MMAPGRYHHGGPDDALPRHQAQEHTPGMGQKTGNSLILLIALALAGACAQDTPPRETRADMMKQAIQDAKAIAGKVADTSEIETQDSATSDTTADSTRAPD